MLRIVRFYIILLCLAFVGLSAYAQESSAVPRRTPEERAMKQTEMLVRDLEIKDSVVRDTIYKVHLRYARSRELVHSRLEAIECMDRLLAELKGILNKKQFERLQSIPRRQGARAPHAERDSLAQSPTPREP